MEQAAALEAALANTTRLVQGIAEDQWDQATPCAKWNVRQLVTHTAGVMANFQNGAANKPVADPDAFELGQTGGQRWPTCRPATWPLGASEASSNR